MPILAEYNICTGCTACASICPQHCLTMQADENGFLNPVLTAADLCVNCGRCENICPVLHPQNVGSQDTGAFAMYSLDAKLREASSSGGVFSELALQILAHGGAIYGAAYASDFSVRHICVTDAAELSKLRGAKYAQSELDSCFVQIWKRLKNGQKVLFSGTPCQVAGLKAFLHQEYENLICVDFVCHGVPSPMAWHAYVHYRAEQDNGGTFPEKINLRSKHTGWSRYHYSNLYKYTDGSTYSALSGNDLFMKLFVGNYLSRESCSNCLFKGYNRVSDITIGDFWGIWDIAPEMDDNKGTSLVLVHSENGKKLLSSVSHRLKAKEMTLSQASQQNRSLVEASPARENRKEILEAIQAGQIGDMITLFPRQRYGIVTILREKFRRIIQLFSYAK